MAVIEAYKTTYLEADAASVIFNNFDVGVGPYNNLYIHYSAATDDTTGDWRSIAVVVNAITTGNEYQYFQVYSTGTSVSAFSSGSNNTRSGWITTSSTPAGNAGGAPQYYASGVIFIPDPLSANKLTTMQTLGGKVPPISGRGLQGLTAGHFDNAGAGALNKTVSLTLSPETGNWLRGSTFTVYGLVTA